MLRRGERNRNREMLKRQERNRRETTCLLGRRGKRTRKKSLLKHLVHRSVHTRIHTIGSSVRNVATGITLCVSVLNIVLPKAVGFVSLVVFVRVDVHIIILLTDLTLTVSVSFELHESFSVQHKACARHSILKRQFGLLRPVSRRMETEVRACL